ncbi:Uncharacterized protein Rs2_16900 [Raphanus sativus]|uniref:Uncharacterized protein LOC130495920 n=1 Tax=Raphanus sativus TaxID=3726 RepID=A0A9W3DPX4_RAPSA|nr:uncharacterized protein LOC130495920 [Raphanus sativus]XP_056865870.1 uncharacterized protein LOC130511945 [Raphanus sativus]KAJ4891559.1 Uncharacterized protein Rs2_31307 [Raphanus sativus]KAJ4902949.1 Uncharacterized protein Rs2_16900 [Raphanus sativus]
MAPLVEGPASLPRPPSDPPDSSLKVALPSNPPDPPVPPDPPPDTLSFTDFLQLYDLWATATFKFSDPELCLMISYELVSLDLSFSVVVPTVSVAFQYVAFVGTSVVDVCSLTAVCRRCSFTAVCRFTSTFALMAFAMIREHCFEDASV